MTNILPEEVSAILSDLEDDPRYKTLARERTDPRVERFVEDVRNVRTKCYLPGETVENVRRDLRQLQSECSGALAPFRSFLTRALASLDNRGLDGKEAK
jgi:hypothetical protein